MKNYQKEALQFAKRSILEKFWKDDLSWCIPLNTELYDFKSCFVTLKTWWSNLRWCIWTIKPSRELYVDIISNAKSAAFNDSRFAVLTYEELDDLFVVITILSPITKMTFGTLDKLLIYMWENHPWLVIELWDKYATFLPSVWKELPNSDYFLQHLLQKAWISFEEFIKNFDKVNIEVYFWEEFWDYFKNI